MPQRSETRSFPTGFVRPLRLHHAPGAPSRGAHIALRESGIAFELVRIGPMHPDGDAQRCLTSLDPFGLPPVLEMPDGSTLREAPAIMEYVADLAPDARLAPACGSLERARLAEWLHFLFCRVSGALADRASEDPDSPARAWLAWIDLHLAARPFLLGATYTIADVYLWALWSWSLTGPAHDAMLENIAAWYLRVADREAVRSALRAEA